MKSPAAFPLKRITLAVVLSILAHSLLMWQLLKIKIPATEALLPQLQAKLEPLPKLARKPVKHKPRAKLPVSPQPIAAPVTGTPAAIADAAASSVAASPAGTAAPDSLLPTLTNTEEAASHPLFPRHAHLHFAVQYGSGTFKLGEIIHVLENIDGRYTLHAETQTTGLVSIFKSYHLTQTSTGAVSRHGLRPESYEEIKTDSSGTLTSSARFDWKENKVFFNDGRNHPLSEQAQDVLSLPYHLSQLPLNQESIPISLSNGKDIRQHYLAIGDEGTISTAMGELRTIALHKVHGANEEGLIIWLALEYRLLPVKILYLDKSGEVSANMVITDIRVSDE